MNIFEIISQDQVAKLPPEYCTRSSSVVMMGESPVITNPKHAAMQWDADLNDWKKIKVASNK